MKEGGGEGDEVPIIAWGEMGKERGREAHAFDYSGKVLDLF